MCTTTDLRVAVGPGNGALGSIYYPLEFTNTGSSPCTLYGYPGVSFATPSGSQIGAPASRDRTHAPALVTVQPGSAVSATLQITDAANYPQSRCGQTVDVNWLKVYPPDSYTALAVSIGTQACTSKSLVTMSVSPISSGG
jgi:hypothetical protein